MNNFYCRFENQATEEEKMLALKVTPIMDELIGDFSEIFETDPVAAFKKLYPMLRRGFSIKKKHAIVAYLLQCMFVTGRWKSDREIYLPDEEDVACALVYIRKEGKKMKNWHLHVVDANDPAFNPDDDCTYEVKELRIYNK